MGKIKYFEGNKGANLGGDIENYEVVTMTASSLLLRYDPAKLGPFEGDRPWEVAFSITGGVLETQEEGDEAGTDRYVGGKITEITLYDAAGDALIAMTGLKVSAAYAWRLWANEAGYNLVDHILGGGHVFVGSTEAEIGDSWSGDNIATGAGRDVVRAGGGNDWIEDLGGRDVYIGGAGEDGVMYFNHRWADPGASQGIVANLAKGWIKGSDGLKDKVKSIENVTGTMFDDVMKGNAKDNIFTGLLGNDKFIGGKGFDGVDYGHFEWLGGTTGVRVNLATGTARDAFGTVDKLKSIEFVYGTDTDDVFRDDRKNNWFEGRDGDDTFYLGKGSDGVEGGDGADLFIFVGDHWGDQKWDHIDDFEDGIDRIQIENAASFAELTIAESDDGRDTWVTWGDNGLELRDFTAADLTAADFIFAST